MVCVYCGEIGVFTAELRLRALRSGELEALPKDMQKQLRKARQLVGRERPPMPAGYSACCDRIAKLIPEWIERQCMTRTLDLQWHRWDKTVFAGSMDGERAKYLAASPDAVELLHYLDEKTGGQGTLLMAKVVLEHLGIKRREDN
jgi:hypothetical protein